MEISFEPWEGVQRHGQDLEDRILQGFTGLLQVPPQFPWPPAPHKRMPFDIDLPVVPFGSHPDGDTEASSCGRGAWRRWPIREDRRGERLKRVGGSGAPLHGVEESSGGHSTSASIVLLSPHGSLPNSMPIDPITAQLDPLLPSRSTR